METPLTGQPCTCRKGVERDNCPQCEGSGMRIDFAAIHRERAERQLDLRKDPTGFGRGR